MNFLCLGTVFILMQLNLGWISNYAVKLIGFAITLVGIDELRDLCDVQQNNSHAGEATEFSRKRNELLELTKKRGIVFTAVCAISVVGMVLAKYVLNKVFETGKFYNGASILFGTIVTLMALEFFGEISKFILKNEKDGAYAFLNDRSNAVRLDGTYRKIVWCTLGNLAFDLLNRLIPSGILVELSGFLAAISKIVLYGFIITAVVQFNKMRLDCNNKYEM